MTPAEFELAQERLEDSYRKGEIGAISFYRGMSALGFKIETIREALKELDEVRTR